MELNLASSDVVPASASRDVELAPQLVAATAAVLHRYTDRAELVIGCMGADGDLRPLAIDMADDPTFAVLLARVSGMLAIQSAQDEPVPDAVVATDGQPAADQHHPWLSARRQPDGIELTLHNGATLEPGPGGLFVGHLRTLLAAATAEPDTPISALPLLTEHERDRLLVEWNDTAAAYPDACMHELVERQARSTPDAIAVRFGEEQLTYAELDARANQLAHHLVSLGVGRDVLVGICVERSLEMLVGLLGIAKAGGAYVPIDPEYPVERQEYMLTMSAAPVVLTQDRLRPDVPAGDATVVCLDSDWGAFAQVPTTPPDVAHDPEQLAYVIYTSGSTGKPKGVQIPHRALVNFLVTMQRQPRLMAEDVLVAVTTLSFDIAGLELYLPLITGAQVVIASAQTAANPRALSQLLEDSDATIMQATPTTWRMLLDSGWPGRSEMKGLCGGEALPQALADRLVASGIELWNMYGPTETTIWSTCAQVHGGSQPLTIGRPIANTTIYILDGTMKPVPVGVAGELWIGGDGLARGYRGRDDLTAERFVAHPFDDTPGARVYRTGDLARYRADGTIDFLGRIDHQVKVRGFRIELGEIETVLARHPAIADAVVVARGSDAAAELHAYAIAHGAPVPTHELRQHLSATLPAYMVPSTVTTLDAFPLTPNGKVDRKALPEPTRERSGERELIAPRTPLERQLATIWERELQVSPIGVTDNFFDLGVTSVVAATLFAAIEHELGSQLPLGAIFRAPTIESLAGLLERGADSSRWTSLVPIQPLGSKPPIFCIHGGAGTILHLAGLARRLGEDQPFYGLQSRGLYGGVAPLKSVEEMATHYLSEMREVHPGGPWRLGGYCFGAIVAFELAQRLVAQGEEVELLVSFNGPSPAWIKRWGWHGNQPSWRPKLGLKPLPPPEKIRAIRRRRKLMMPVKMLARVPRALKEPHRILRSIHYFTRTPRTRLLLALGRPIPERDRELFFFDLHINAEAAYEPTPYPGEMCVFYGNGLYEDPTLGWAGLATSGLLSFAVPGEHRSNRGVMREPAVAFVAERLEEYLGD